MKSRSLAFAGLLAPLIRPAWRNGAGRIARRGGVRSVEARALREAGFRRVSREEDLYWRRCTAPMNEAAAALAFTPAPDLAAVRAKIAILRAHALDEPEVLPRNALELVDEDLERLEG